MCAVHRGDFTGVYGLRRWQQCGRAALSHDHAYAYAYAQPQPHTHPYTHP